jgi:uncharacterized protein (DUF1800 family)
MIDARQILIVSALALFTANAAGHETPEAAPAPAMEWNARNVEHLMNRAGFGARPGEINSWVKRSRSELVESLLEDRSMDDVFFHEYVEMDRKALQGLPAEERRARISDLRAADRRQGRDFMEWWLAEMVNGESPLRERMVLFWHGLFTSSVTKVKRSQPLIIQNEFFRAGALGSYSEMLHGILQDPAMLLYLDNNTNKKDSPNENLARELMELFTLGEGNYTEEDVVQAARALTGRTVTRGRAYRFNERQHDKGEKTILGKTGNFDGDDLANLLLAEEACPRWIAGRLIKYFEGVEPSERRLRFYAAFLREQKFEITPFLRRLFNDPDFYRDEVIGARVQSPVDFMVGSCKRLGMQPPRSFLNASTRILGQRLGDPPNVKGWEGGEAWITTSTFMMRGNLMGVVLGVVDYHDLESGLSEAEIAAEEAMMAEESEPVIGEPTRVDDGFTDAEFDEAPAMGDDVMGDDVMMGDDTMMGDTMMGIEPTKPERKRSDFERLLQGLNRVDYRPRVHLTARIVRRGLKSDDEIVDFMLEELLAIEPPAETRALLHEHVKRERENLGLGKRILTKAGPNAEHLLRRLAHLILSLPEAQLS